MAHPGSEQCDRYIMTLCTEIVTTHNPYAGAYKSMYQLERIYHSELDVRVYNEIIQFEYCYVFEIAVVTNIKK